MDEIRSSIEDGNELQVMWFLDNGIGLDEERMVRLFGDGVGGKTEGSAGSFGVGHLTSFPASNIRYVLYGGVSDSPGKNKTKKSRIFSGHAILAAHTHPINEPYGGIEKIGGGGVDSDRKSHTKTRAYGKDGYLVDDISDRDLFNQRFGFYDEDKCPGIIDDKLDIIEKNFGTGSAIGILDFNRFRRFENDEDSIKSIERAIASHFLPLVFDKRLEVEIYLNGEHYSSIDRSSLKSILERDSHKTRSIKNSVGPSGGNIFDAYRTLENPDPESRSISTSMGNISLRFRSLKGSDERSGTRIQLYRNGMWIEDNIPQNNRSEFNRSDPFNALLLLDPAECPKACEIVRKAEGPRHTDIKPSRLAKADQKKLRGLFSEIRDGLLEIAPPREESETAFFSDFFVLAGRDQAQRNSKPKRADQQSSPGPGTRTGSGADKKKPVRSDGLWTFKRQGSQLNTQSSLVAQEGGFRVILRVKEKVRNAELRLALVSGTDVSCDQPIPDEFIEIGQSAKLGNEPIPDESYIEGDGNKARAIVLGKIEPGDGDLDLWIPCAPPIGSKVEVQIVKRAEKNRVQDR
ncbi:MAG: hypothetical protein ISN28_08460 [Ectothiorhodospiraceae bacterium AqS1]|nr:hypothetical protein [Ectothiorhodospiraceae bacterium AqS1]